MNEQLLQYLWRHSLIQPGNLKTTDGESVTIINPGQYNQNAGPDFLSAKIKIGNTTWAGNIELHVNASDWIKHQHQEDENYKNIILHVVYKQDCVLANISFPTLELVNHIELAYVDRYFKLMSFGNHIPCARSIHTVPEIIWLTWYDRLLAERWEQKLHQWQLIWEQSGKDWRTLLYYRLAANFGFGVNKEPFLNLALSIPLNILSKYRNSLLQTEALLFGQAGLLSTAPQDDYSATLEKEYHYLRRKHQLVPLEPHHWKFLRMRPQNFPTIRIAQFAMLVHTSLGLFAQMMEIEKAQDLFDILDVVASDYWSTHYRFGEQTTQKKEKRLGNDATMNILINTVSPMQFLYAKIQSGGQLQEQSLKLLTSLKPEKNNIITTWQNTGIKAQNAAQSQALLQLFQNYCSHKQCLNCAIGNKLMRNA